MYGVGYFTVGYDYNIFECGRDVYSFYAFILGTQWICVGGCCRWPCLLHLIHRTGLSWFSAGMYSSFIVIDVDIDCLFNSYPPYIPIFRIFLSNLLKISIQFYGIAWFLKSFPEYKRLASDADCSNVVHIFWQKIFFGFGYEADIIYIYCTLMDFQWDLIKVSS